MNFSASERPQRWGGLGAVIALHLVILYALVVGLQRNPADLIAHTVEVRLMDDAAPTAPAAPPQPQVQPETPKTMATRAPAVQTQATAPEVSEAPEAPEIPKTSGAPEAPAAPPTAEAVPTEVVAPTAARPPAAAILCPGYQDAIRNSPPPREVMAEGLGGEVLVEFTVMPNGTVRNPIPISSTNLKLNRWALSTVLTKIRCQGQTQPVQLRVPISVRFE